MSESDERHARLISQVSFLVGYYEAADEGPLDVPVELLKVALDGGDVLQAVRSRPLPSRSLKSSDNESGPPACV